MYRAIASLIPPPITPNNKAAPNGANAIPATEYISMTLYPNWKNIIKKAWSIRLMLLAGILTCCEAILPLYADHFPRKTFAIITVLVIIAAMFARVVAQRDV